MDSLPPVAVPDRVSQDCRRRRHDSRAEPGEGQRKPIMRRPSRRISRLLGFTVVPVSLVATGLFVTTSSYSVFNATTTNGLNSWQAGSISLQNDGAVTTAASFTPTNIRPGASATGSRCIIVQYTGSNTVPANIKMYASGVADTGLGAGINLTITSGSNTTGAAGSCTGFQARAAAGDVFSGTLSGFEAKTSYSNPASAYTWNPTGTGSQQTLTYKIDWSLPDGGVPGSSTTGDNVYQGKSSAVNFVWEAQTT
jgi:hypothetical protein